MAKRRVLTLLGVTVDVRRKSFAKQNSTGAIIGIPNSNSNKRNFKLFVAQVKLQRAYGGCLGTDSR